MLTTTLSLLTTLITLLFKIMKNLDDELRDLSPLLRDLKRQDDGLRAPEGYFDDFEAQMSGKLAAIGGGKPWPEQQTIQPYNLVGKVVARLTWSRTTELVQRTTKLRRQALPALAAGLALVAAAVWFFRSPSIVHQAPMLAQVTMPELSEEDIESYVLENVHEFDTEQLASLPAVETSDAAPEPTIAKPSQKRSKRQQALDNLRPEDVNNMLDGLSDEDLEKLL